MKKIHLSLLLSFFLTAFIVTVASASAMNEEEFDPVAAAKETQTAYENITDYTAVFFKQERKGKKMGKKETILFKFRKPNDIYMKWIEKPFKGQEAIYRKDLNDNKITAHRGGILGLVSLDLKPESKLVMQGQHHRISDAGIGATDKLVYRSLMQGLSRKEITIKNHGIEKLNGRDVRKIEAIFPKKCEGSTYEVKKGETLWDIAEKVNQDMYIIMTVNKGVDSPKDIKPGQKILIPYHYCYRSLTYVDVETKILTKLEIFDWDNQPFEVYEFTDLKFNVGLTDNDFDKKNSEYKF